MPDLGTIALAIVGLVVLYGILIAPVFALLYSHGEREKELAADGGDRHCSDAREY